jgi:hypothetical protein
MILAAVDLAIGRDESIDDVHPVLEPVLVIRGSTGPVPGQHAQPATS